MADDENNGRRPPRRSQQERREGTRRKVLDAAHTTLIERGYSGASTWAICETGGFSKGTLLHHFRQRSHVFQALIADLSRHSLSSLDEAMNRATPGSRIDTFLDWLWSTLDGDFFVIGLEILTGARTDPALRETVRLGGDALSDLLDKFIELAVQDVADNKQAALRSALRSSVHLVRGIGLDLAIGGDRAEHARRFETWRETVHAIA